MTPMSEMGQTRHFDRAPVTSGLPQSTDILRVRQHVSKVPDSDMSRLYRREVSRHGKGLL
jgi:hypothetical protein